MNTKTTIIASVGLAAVVAGALGAATIVLSNSTSTTEADPAAAAAATAEYEIPAEIVAGRIQSRYHPLPWVGSSIDSTVCPAALPALVGATMTCTAISDGATVNIPVTVTEVDGTDVIWDFQR